MLDSLCSAVKVHICLRHAYNRHIYTCNLNMYPVLILMMELLPMVLNK